MSSYVYDGDALLDEQASLLSSSTPFDINYIAFLRTKLNAQQRLTMQRRQDERRASSMTPPRAPATSHAVERVRTSLDLQSPEPRGQRRSVSSERLTDSPGSGVYRPFMAGAEGFSVYSSQTSAARRGSAGLASGGRRGTTDWESVDAALPPPTPITFDDVPASATTRQELASVSNMGESLTNPESFLRESRARSIVAESSDAVRSSAANPPGPSSAALDERAAVAKGKPVVPEDAMQFATGDTAAAANFVPCPHCGRTFAPDRVDRHAELCAKMKAREAKKPKVDVVKSKRMTDLYDGESVKPAAAHRSTKGSDSLNSTWRRQSAQLRTALSGSTNGAADMYPVEDDRVQCPGCGRRFAKDVADRHVPHCVSKASRA